MSGEEGSEREWDDRCSSQTVVKTSGHWQVVTMVMVTIVVAMTLPSANNELESVVLISVNQLFLFVYNFFLFSRPTQCQSVVHSFFTFVHPFLPSPYLHRRLTFSKHFLPFSSPVLKSWLLTTAALANERLAAALIVLKGYLDEREGINRRSRSTAVLPRKIIQVAAATLYLHVLTIITTVWAFWWRLVTSSSSSSSSSSFSWLQVWCKCTKYFPHYDAMWPRSWAWQCSFRHRLTLTTFSTDHYFPIMRTKTLFTLSNEKR